MPRRSGVVSIEREENASLTRNASRSNKKSDFTHPVRRLTCSSESTEEIHRLDSRVVSVEKKRGGSSSVSSDDESSEFDVEGREDEPDLLSDLVGENEVFGPS